MSEQIDIDNYLHMYPSWSQLRVKKDPLNSLASTGRKDGF